MRLADGYTLTTWNQEFLHSTGPLKPTVWDRAAALRDQGLTPSEVRERLGLKAVA